MVFFVDAREKESRFEQSRVGVLGLGFQKEIVPNVFWISCLVLFTNRRRV